MNTVIGHSKLLNRYKLAKSYLRKDDYCQGLPRTLCIEVTNRCNLKCVMCSRNSMTRKIGDMDIELFKKIIDEGKNYLEFVGLQVMGEPLLHKDIFKMIDYCKRHKVKVGFSTNATMMNNGMIEGIVNSGVDHIIFAFDGATKETYEKIRISASYDNVVNNIKNFLQVKRDKRLNIFVVMQCIYMKHTENEIDEFAKMWNIEGVNAIRLRQVTYSGNAMGEKFINKKNSFPCYWPWSQPVIMWNGDIVPCCQDFDALCTFGNLSENTLEELWNNEKIRSLRRELIKGNYDNISICKNCNMYQPSLPLVIGSTFFNYYTINKLVPAVESAISRWRFNKYNSATI